MEQLISEIRLDDLHESPFNPRKTFTDIEELAADIKSDGRVLQPLGVRARMVDPTALQPEDMFDGYEVVFGHRRLRASRIAGLMTVPCMVLTMTDAEARRAQIRENLQRKDIHPIEEAEGFQALMRDHGVTAEALAEQTGKSESFIRSRLTLLKACPEVREACVRGEIGSETALLVARLRSEKLQAKALHRIKAKCYSLEDGGKKSFRAIRELLLEEFATDLKSALWDLADGTLLPDAGSCSACPKRSGNAPEYLDVAQGKKKNDWSSTPVGADVCTDPECYRAKKTAHLQREARTLEAEGRTVVGGNAAKAAMGANGTVKGAYVALKDIRKDLKDVPKAQRPQVVLIQDQRTGDIVEAVRRTDAQQVGVKVAAKASQQDLYAAERRVREEQQQKAQEKAKALMADRMTLLQAVRHATLGKPLCDIELRAAAAAALDGVEWQSRPLVAKLWGTASAHDLKKRVLTMTPAEALQLLRDCAIVADGFNVPPHEAHNPGQARTLKALAEQCGLAKPAASAKAKPAKKTAKAAPAKKATAAADATSEATA